MSGGIAVAVNTRSAQPEVEFVLADSGARVDLAADAPLPDGQPYVAEGLVRTDTAALFYTSGTTGHPKGVPTSHEAFLTNLENVLRCQGLSRDVGAGLRTLLGAAVPCNRLQHTASSGRRGGGGTAVILPVLNLDQLIASLRADRITSMVTVPAIYSLLLRHKDSLTSTCPVYAMSATVERPSRRRWWAR